jgi:hypothetical protein
MQVIAKQRTGNGLRYLPSRSPPRYEDGARFTRRHVPRGRYGHFDGEDAGFLCWVEELIADEIDLTVLPSRSCVL